MLQPGEYIPLERAIVSLKRDHPEVLKAIAKAMINAQKVRPDFVLHTGDLTHLSRLGVSVLPASYQRMRIDGVVYRPLLDPLAMSAVWLVQRKDQKSPMVTAFVELLTRKVEVT